MLRISCCIAVVAHLGVAGCGSRDTSLPTEVATAEHGPSPHEIQIPGFVRTLHTHSSQSSVSFFRSSGTPPLEVLVRVESCKPCAPISLADFARRRPKLIERLPVHAAEDKNLTFEIATAEHGSHRGMQTYHFSKKQKRKRLLVEQGLKTWAGNGRTRMTIEVYPTGLQPSRIKDDMVRATQVTWNAYAAVFRAPAVVGP